MYFQKQKKVVKTEELVENLCKEQLDSQVPSLRPRSKEGLSLDPGGDLEVHTQQLLNHKYTELVYTRNIEHRYGVKPAY